MKSKLFLSCLSWLTIVFTITPHKLIISISQPCSLSVAFLRMMRQRGDFLISHEPGVLAYRMATKPEKVDLAEYPHEVFTFPEVGMLIKDLVNQKDTFVKEECYAALRYLFNDPEILKSKETYTVFLIRNPHHVLLSYYGKSPNKISGGSVIDFAAMWQLFNEIKAQGSHTPLIIVVEDLIKNPEFIVKQFCTDTNIPFKENSLHWEDLSSNFGDKKIWHDTPYARFDKIWHGNALKSTCFFNNEKSYIVDSNGMPTFGEINDAEIRADYLKFYEESLTYYQLFLNECHKQTLEHGW